MSRKSFQERGLLGTLSSSERMNSALVQLCVDRQQLVKSEPGPRGEDQSEGVVSIPSFLLVDLTLSATQKHTHTQLRGKQNILICVSIFILMAQLLDASGLVVQHVRKINGRKTVGPTVVIGRQQVSVYLVVG